MSARSSSDDSDPRDDRPDSALPEGQVRETDAPAGEGLSALSLSRAFAEMSGAVPEDDSDPSAASDDEAQATGDGAGGISIRAESSSDKAPHGGSRQVDPRGVLEAILFVGNRENVPLTAEHVVGLLPGVQSAEVDQLVQELNARYEGEGCPYHVIAEGSGYRLVLRPEYERLRDKFYNRVRRARLSQAAIDVLALVAYNEPISTERINAIRRKPSGHLLNQLVRRQLLRVERSSDKQRMKRFSTTQRFLDLFKLRSLDDLPQRQQAASR
jgi:segregation and condensation protein B